MTTDKPPRPRQLEARNPYFKIDYLLQDLPQNVPWMYLTEDTVAQS